MTSFAAHPLFHLRGQRIILRVLVPDEMDFNPDRLHVLLHGGLNLASVDRAEYLPGIPREKCHQSSSAMESVQDPCWG